MRLILHASDMATNALLMMCRLRETVLQWIPVSHNKATGNLQATPGDSPLKAVLRSKGFMWMANSHNTAFFWSHAGQHFEVRDEGEW